MFAIDYLWQPRRTLYKSHINNGINRCLCLLADSVAAAPVAAKKKTTTEHTLVSNHNGIKFVRAYSAFGVAICPRGINGKSLIHKFIQDTFRVHRIDSLSCSKVCRDFGMSSVGKFDLYGCDFVFRFGSVDFSTGLCSVTSSSGWVTSCSHFIIIRALISQ